MGQRQQQLHGPQPAGGGRVGLLLVPGAAGHRLPGLLHPALPEQVRHGGQGGARRPAGVAGGVDQVPEMAVDGQRVHLPAGTDQHRRGGGPLLLVHVGPADQAQAGGCHVGAAGGQRVSGGVVQHGHRPGGVGPAGGHQVFGHRARLDAVLVQHLGGPLVQAPALLRGHVGQDGPADARVAQPVLVQQAGGAQQPYRRCGRLGHHVQQVAEQIRRGRAVQHGKGLRDPADGRLVPVEATEHGLVERVAEDGVRGGLLVRLLAQPLLDEGPGEQRVAAGHPQAAFGGLPRGRLGVVVDQPGDRLDGQRRQRDPAEVWLAEQLRPEVRVRRAQHPRLGQHHHDRGVPQPAGHVQQAVQRRRVGVMHVVDGQHQRARLGQVEQRAEQPVQDRRRDPVGCRRPVRALPAGLGQGWDRLPQQALHPGRRLRAQARAVQQLPEHAQVQPALRPRAGRAEHPPAGGGGPVAERLQHTRLAAAHRSGHQRHVPSSLPFAAPEGIS
ncbi:hypothetical protein B0E53_05550 [Micromonospora sp. MH33]|nr:hypothetical protein B0E53_05550 [Micromonospora sp. MH33]